LIPRGPTLSPGGRVSVARELQVPGGRFSFLFSARRAGEIFVRPPGENNKEGLVRGLKSPATIVRPPGGDSPITVAVLIGPSLALRVRTNIAETRAKSVFV